MMSVFDKLRALCGYVEDGSERRVVIVQDDATRDWIIALGETPVRYYGRSLSAAIEEAYEQEVELDK